MKTKNVKVRIKDVKQGKILYISHPFYGIDKVTVVSRPYVSKHTGFLFFDIRTSYGTTSKSICDAGISPGEGYNNRRTFFKRKHAEEYQNRMKDDPKVIAVHLRHEQSIRDSEEWDYL